MSVTPTPVTNQTPQLWAMTLYKGSSWPKDNFTINDSLGNPKPPATVIMQVKYKASDTTILKTLTSAGQLGFIISGAGLNVVTFNSTVDLPVTKDETIPLVADIKVTFATGEVKYYFSVTIIVKQSITT